MKTRTHVLLIAFLTALPAAPTAFAGEPEIHDGFYGRFQVGLGYTRQTSEPLTIQGEGALLALAAGAMVTEQLGFYGEIFESNTSSPSFHPNGAFRDDDADLSSSVYGIGAGVVYYFLPSNLYTSLTVGVVRSGIYERMQRDEDRQTFRTSYGIGSSLSFGKEWWLDTEFALGGAAVLQLSRIADQDDTTWHDGTFGLVMSATYN